MSDNNDNQNLNNFFKRILTSWYASNNDINLYNQFKSIVQELADLENAPVSNATRTELNTIANIKAPSTPETANLLTDPTKITITAPLVEVKGKLFANGSTWTLGQETPNKTDFYGPMIRTGGWSSSLATTYTITLEDLGFQEGFAGTLHIFLKEDYVPSINRQETGVWVGGLVKVPGQGTAIIETMKHSYVNFSVETNGNNIRATVTSPDSGCRFSWMFIGAA